MDTEVQRKAKAAHDEALAQEEEARKRLKSVDPLPGGARKTHDNASAEGATPKRRRKKKGRRCERATERKNEMAAEVNTQEPEEEPTAEKLSMMPRGSDDERGSPMSTSDTTSDLEGRSASAGDGRTRKRIHEEGSSSGEANEDSEEP